MEARAEPKMNRSEAQGQLLVLGQAMREGRIPDPRDYPVLHVKTREGLPLWRVNVRRLLDRDWTRERVIDWLEYKAIDELILDK